MKIGKRLLSIVLCLVLVVGLLPVTAMAVQTTITEANITIAKPVGGESPDFSPVSDEPNKYYIEDAHSFSWSLMEGLNYPTLGSGDKFTALKRYELRVMFRAKTGFTFADDCVFTINGESTGCWGNPGNEFRYIYWYAADPQNPTYTVSFNADGGMGTMAEVTDVFGEYTLPQCTFTAPSGKYFSGWSVGGFMKDPGETITVLNDTDVSACWRTIPAQGHGYSVTYDGGGESGGSMEGKTDFYGELTLPACGFTPPANKQFSCWQVGNNYWNPNDKIIITFNTTVYAIWEDIPQQPTTYGINCCAWNLTDNANNAAAGTVSVQTDKGSQSGSAASGSATENTSVRVTAAANSGYEFIGWRESVPSNPGSTVSTDASYTFNATETVWLYAVFQKQPTEISTINITGIPTPTAGASPDVTGIATDTAGITLGTIQWQYGNGHVMNANNGDTFAAGTTYMLYVGYNVDNGYEKAQQVAVTTPNFTPDNNGVEVNHAWIGIKYTIPAPQPTMYNVAYDANSGSGTMNGGEVAENGTFTLDACGFTAPVGQRFKAWAIGSVNGEQKQPSEQITITGHTTIYAIWEDIPQQPTEITAVTATVSGATAGATAGSTTVTTNDSTYTVSIKNWYDCDNVFNYGSAPVLQSSDTFVGGKTYTVAVTVTPVGNTVLADASNITVEINGEDGKIGGGEGVNSRNYFITVTVPAPQQPPVVTLTDIVITTPPTKTTYTAGESFDPTGMVVTAYYSNQSSRPLRNNEYTYAPAGALTANDTEITVTYDDGLGTIKTAEQPITVATSITIEIPVRKEIDSNATFSGSETFTFEVEVLNSNVEMEALAITGNSVTVTSNNGGSTTISIAVPADTIDDFYDEGIKITEKAGNAAGWTYSTEEYYVAFDASNGYTPTYSLDNPATSYVREVVFTNSYAPVGNRPPLNPPYNPAPGSTGGSFTAAKTFDGGIGLSVAVTILSAAGGAWLAKKKED